MILNRQRLFFSFAILGMALFSAACVEVPETAPDPPVLNASFRFVAIHPTGSNPPASISIAAGPNYTSSTTYNLTGNANATNFITFPSGSKRIIYNNGVQNDTLVATFETDERATLLFARNQRHDSLAKDLVTALKLQIRRTFNANGLQDTALVRFVNLAQRVRQDRFDVYRSDSTQAAGVVLANDLAYGATSTGTAIAKIRTGRTANFFVTRYDDAGRVFKDSVAITGASRKIYTVFVYDQYDSTAAVALQNANVKVKVLEEF